MKQIHLTINFLIMFSIVIALFLTLQTGCMNKNSTTEDPLTSKTPGILALSLSIPSSSSYETTDINNISGQIPDNLENNLTSPIVKMVITIQGVSSIYTREIPVISSSGKVLLDDTPTGTSLPVTIEGYNINGLVTHKTRFRADFVSGQTTTSTAVLTELLDFSNYFPLNTGDTWYETDCIRSITGPKIFNNRPSTEIKETSYYGKIKGYEYFNITSSGIEFLGEIEYKTYDGAVYVRAKVMEPPVILPRYVQPGDRVSINTNFTEKAWNSSIVSGIESPASALEVSSSETSFFQDKTGTEQISFHIVSRQAHTLSNSLAFSDTLKFIMNTSGSEIENEIIIAAKNVGFIYIEETDSENHNYTMTLNGYKVKGVSGGDISGNPPSSSDVYAPIISNPAISFSFITETSINLLWNPAVDNATQQSNLLYKVYKSLNSDIENYNNALANGTPCNEWTQNINTLTISQISPSDTNRFNVFVKDESGNISQYAMVSTDGPANTDAIQPVISNKLINVSFFTENSIMVYWNAASDNITQQFNLFYKVFFSTNELNINSITTIETGTTPFNDWSENLLAAEITGLNPDTSYYINVLVKDEAGNKNIYSAVTQTTRASSIPPASGEYWVDSAVSVSGNGSTSAPFKTLPEAVLALASSGGAIRLVQGNHIVDSPLILNGNFNIKGGYAVAGDSLSTNKSTIDFSGLTSGTAVTANGNLAIYTAILIGNTTIKGIQCNNGEFISSNCDFTYFTEALEILGTQSLPNTNKVDIDFVNFMNSQNAVKIAYNSSSLVTLNNVNFSGCESALNIINTSTPVIKEAMIYGRTDSASSKAIAVSDSPNTEISNISALACANAMTFLNISGLHMYDIKINSSENTSSFKQGIALSGCTDFLIYRGSTAGMGEASIGVDIASSTGTLSNFIAAPANSAPLSGSSRKGFNISSCSSSLILHNNLLFSCTEGIFLDNSTPIIKACLFDSCSPYSVKESDSNSNFVTLEYNFFRHSPYYDATYSTLTSQSAFESAIGSYAATGNIFYESPNEPSSPIMLMPQSGDFRPGTDSPLIDAGPSSIFPDSNLPVGGTTRNDIGPAGGPKNTADISAYMIIGY